MKSFFRCERISLIALSLLFFSVSSCTSLRAPNETPNSNDFSQSPTISVGATKALPKGWVTGCFTPGLWATKGNFICSDEEICSENRSVSGDDRIERSIEMMQDE